MQREVVYASFLCLFFPALDGMYMKPERAISYEVVSRIDSLDDINPSVGTIGSW